MVPRIRSFPFWLHALCTAGALLAVLVILSAGSVRPASAQSEGGVRQVTLPAPRKLSSPRLAGPPVLSDAEKADLQSAESVSRPRGPLTRPGASARAASARPAPSTPRADVRDAASARSGAAVTAPGDLVLYQKADLYGVVNGHQSLIDEPSAANGGMGVIETGNWYAAVSSDGGNTFGFINPATISPLYGGFCCHQSVLYAPSRGLFVWIFLYRPDANGNNAIGLAVLHGAAALASNPVAYDFYDGLTPQLAGFALGESFDYPQIALGNNYLYISANVFKNGLTGPFDGDVVMRLPLDSLAGAGGLALDIYGLGGGYFNATFAQGATGTMYFAAQADTATLRVYQWAELAAAPVATDVPHTAYPAPLSNYANYTCPVNGTQDWCGRLDDRVETGWVSGGLIAFMWNAPAGTGGFGSFAYPYVQIAFVNRYSMTLAGESAMYNQSWAYAYPAAAVNAVGYVAGTLFFGGGLTPPTVAAFIWDNFTFTPYPQIPVQWDIYPLVASTQGPTGPTCSNCWGDFLAARPDNTSPYTRYLWMATGYTLQGGGADGNVHPYYLRFGRAANNPAVVQANEHLVFLPMTRTGQ